MSTQKTVNNVSVNEVTLFLTLLSEESKDTENADK